MEKLKAKIASRRKRRSKAVRKRLEAEQPAQPQPSPHRTSDPRPGIEIPDLVMPELNLPQPAGPRPRDEIDARDALPELGKLDRYEKRFLTRRDRAIRALIAARVTEAWASGNRR